MQEAQPRVPNETRTARTRGALIAAGRALFVGRGFAATGTPEIAARAGVTRGALYHHFVDKRALFGAVLDAEHAAVAAAIEAAVPSDAGGLAALRAGASAYLAAMRSPGRTALMLIEGPAALGAEAARDADARHARRSLRDGLAAAMDAGAISSAPLEALCDVLGAAFDGAALALLRGRPDAEVSAAVLALIDGLGVTAPR